VRSTTAKGLERWNSLPVSRCLPMVSCAYVALTFSPASFITPNFSPSRTPSSEQTSPCSSSSAKPLSPSSFTTAIMQPGLVLHGHKATLRSRSAIPGANCEGRSPTSTRKGHFIHASPDLCATLASTALKDYERLLSPSKTTYRPNPRPKVLRLCRSRQKSCEWESSGGRLTALMSQHVTLSRRIRALRQRYSCDFDLYSLLKRLKT